jgi:putative ABC transport system permease protein
MEIRSFVETMLQDFRHAARSFIKTPVFTMAVVFSLALGIGANTSVFSLIDAVLLQTLPVNDPSTLVKMSWGQVGKSAELFSYPMYQQLRDRNSVFSSVIAWERSLLTINETGGSEQVLGISVSGNYFPTLGVSAPLGRLISPDDDREGAGSPVAVIGYGYWQRQFGGSPDVIGKSLQIDGVRCTIIGVMPSEFYGTDVGRRPVVAVPLNLSDQLNSTSSRMKSVDSIWLNVMARRRSDISLEQAQAGMSAVWPNLLREAVPENFPAKELQEFMSKSILLSDGSNGLSQLRQQFSSSLLALMGVVVLVLLITCANIANLILARASARRQEMAVRMALGAGGWRLIRQTITESVLLAGLGFVLGIVLAYGAGYLLLEMISTGTTSVNLNLAPNLRVLSFTALTTILTGILVGIVPAWQASKINAGAALAATSRGVIGERARWSVSKILIIGQIAVSIVLLVCAGLFVRTFQNLNKLDAGFHRENVLLIRIDPRRTGYRDMQLANFYHQLLERAKTLPGVRSASLSSLTPISGDMWSSAITVEGYTPQPNDNLRVYFNSVAPDYFKTLGTPLLLGRDFDDRDAADAQHIAIINESVAREFFPGANPIGRHLNVDRDPDRRNLEIIGVVKDAKYMSLREQRSHTVYVAYRQQTKRLKAMILSISAGSGTAEAQGGIVRAVQRELHALNPEAMMTHKQLQQVVDQSMMQEHLLARLGGFFGLLALALVSIGIYGVTAYTMARRTKEIGIRIAIGATRSEVLRMVLREVFLLLIIGFLAGIPLALLTGRYISSQLFGLSAIDPVVFSLTIILMVVVAMLAGLLPAVKASRVDPLIALRHE